MSDPALTKLLKIDSELLAQEAELTTQLEALKVKRASLQDVLQMFDSTQKKIDLEWQWRDCSSAKIVAKGCCCGGDGRRTRENSHQDYPKPAKI